MTHKKVKTPEAGEYIGQACPRRGRVQGDFFLGMARRTAEVYYVPVSPGVEIEVTVTSQHHQCDDIGRGRCASTPPNGVTFPGPDKGGPATFDPFGAEWYAPLPGPAFRR